MIGYDMGRESSVGKYLRRVDLKFQEGGGKVKLRRIFQI